MSRFFYHDGFDFHVAISREEAQTEAAAALEAMTDGETAEEAALVCWGEILQEAIETVTDTVESAAARGDTELVEDMERNGWDYFASWALKDTVPE